jgi:hypothetical protein
MPIGPARARRQMEKMPAVFLLAAEKGKMIHVEGRSFLQPAQENLTGL